MKINEKLLWIHCNKCYEIYVFKRFKFYLLSCKHIFCEKCTQFVLGKVDETVNGDVPRLYTCKYCVKQMRGIQIGNNIPEHVKTLFHPEPWRNLHNVIEVLQFQSEHRKRFELHLIKKHTHIGELEHYLRKFEPLLERTKTSIMELHAENRRLEKRVAEIKRHTKEIETTYTKRARSVPRQTQCSIDQSSWVARHQSRNHSVAHNCVENIRMPKHAPPKTASMKHLNVQSFEEMPHNSFHL